MMERSIFSLALCEKKYLETVSQKLQGGGGSFIFYFRATVDDKDSGKFIRYPLHPFIDSCTEFIGYTNDWTNFIHGTLKQVYNRCKIDEVTAEKLSLLLSTEHKSAKTYYMVTVEKCSVVSDIPYKGVVENKEGLNKLIEENGLNGVLFKYSPKVIDV